MKNSIIRILLFISFTYSSSNIYGEIRNVPSVNYPTIQAGIDSAMHGDTVLVAPGTYYENINFNGKNISLLSQYIFSHDTTDITQTVIDGSDSGCVVIFENGEDSTAILCGFTITNGYTFKDTTRGGGITCINNAAPLLSNLIISSNKVVGDAYLHGGAGILCKNRANPIMRNLTFRDNSAPYCDGGAIKCVDSSTVYLSNSIIQQNESGWGTIYVADSWIELDEILIEENNSKAAGSGLYLEDAYANIRNTKILHNEVINDGGGIYCKNSIVEINNVHIRYNNAPGGATWNGGNGGGLYIIQNSNITIENSLIGSNMVAESGGGIYISNSSLELKNSDIKNNSTGYFGGGIVVFGTTTSIIMEGINIYNNVSRDYGGGIYCGNSENVKITLSNVRIFQNRVIRYRGGGVFCQSPINLVFSSEKLSSIFLNKSHMGGSDFAFDEGDDILTAVLDTFTVSLPEDHHLFPANRFNLTIQNPLFKSVNTDLYVSPEGSDSNSGISASEPLKSVSAALAFASTDSLKQRYINLAPGVYSNSSTGENFPLYGRSNVSIVGKEPHSTIIDGENIYHPFYLYRIEHFGIKNLTIQNGYYEHGVGAGIYTYGGDNIGFENLIIRNNIGSYRGGGINIMGFGSTIYKMKNLLVYGNTTESYQNSSYGIYIEHADAILTNITIANNSMGSDPDLSGGLGISGRSKFSLVNSIITKNPVNSIIVKLYHSNTPTLTIAYSDIEGGQNEIIRDSSVIFNWLEGNIDEDPHFVGGDPFDYHLQTESPCIDAGTALLEFEGDTIVNLLPEEYDGLAPNMGAFGIDPVDFIRREILLPSQFKLYQNYPNPFNSQTTIFYQLPNTSLVNLSVYNITGQLVRVLENGRKPANTYKVNWDAAGYASGIYFFRLSAGNHTSIRKMLLVK